MLDLVWGRHLGFCSLVNSSTLSLCDSDASLSLCLLHHFVDDGLLPGLPVDGSRSHLFDPRHLRTVFDFIIEIRLDVSSYPGASQRCERLAHCPLVLEAWLAGLGIISLDGHLVDRHDVVELEVDVVDRQLFFDVSGLDAELGFVSVKEVPTLPEAVDR